MNPALDHFQPAFRADPVGAFDVERTATGQGTRPFTLGGRTYAVYRNVNLSVYSGQRCNAHCAFCVEELRPAARGTSLSAQKTVLADDAAYFAALERVLVETAPLGPSLSITGGEPSLDPRLPGILERVAAHGLRKRTLTTNGSGLLRPVPGGGDVLDAIVAAQVAHLNLSRAHPDLGINQQVMRFDSPPGPVELGEIVRRARAGGVRPRLSCVVLKGVVETLDDCLAYLEWAVSLGVDNVVFRQLMGHDPARHRPNAVTRYSDAARVELRPILDQLRRPDGERHPQFTFQRHVLGYYYAVEVYRYAPTGDRPPVDVCLEWADLATLETRTRREARDAGENGPTTIHELVFHAGGELCSTWQPGDGRVL